jgi:hypothetical protein
LGMGIILGLCHPFGVWLRIRIVVCYKCVTPSGFFRFGFVFNDGANIPGIFLEMGIILGKIKPILKGWHDYRNTCVSSF